MIVKVVNGEKVSVSNNKLLITNTAMQDNNVESVIREISLKDIKMVILENPNTSITVKSLLRLNESKIPFIICNEKYQPQLQVFDLYSNYKITERLKEQVNWKQIRKEQCFQKIIHCKILHQKELLDFIDDKDGSYYLHDISEKILKSETVAEIKSLEGVGARIYFQKLYDSEFRRFKDDISNNALDYGYTILRNLISKSVLVKGLHPTLGIEHNSIFNNYNLVDDVIEIFRPIVDYVVYMNLGLRNEFCKDYRQELLKVLFQKIEYAGALYEIDNVIDKYLDSLISYMSEKSEDLIFPRLVIDKYEY